MIEDSHISKRYDYAWRIEYKRARCDFENHDPESAVISHLKVPEDIQNNGIGTDMIEKAEEIIKRETEAEVIYIQIGANNGATKHVLENKCGFNISAVYKKEELGRIVDGKKKIR